MNLLERSDAHAVLETALASATAGEGRVVLVSGDAGIGKTSLVEAFLASAASGRVLRGTADDLVTPLPLGAIRDLARQGSPALESAVTAGVGRDVLFDHLVDELERRPHPVVVVVDDVHWADEATLEILTLIGRRIDSFAALLILTYRGHDMDGNHPLRLLVGHLPVGVVERVILEPLSLDAVARLLPDADAVDAYHLTGGNPFFVTELAANTGEIPASVNEVVLARVARMSKESRDLVQLLAIAPGGLAPTVLDEVIDGWATAAQEPERLGLVVLNDGLLSYRHEIARHVVRAGLGDSKRLLLHRSLIGALRHARADPAQLVHHGDAASDRETLIEFAPQAARQAIEAGAHREAVEHLGRMLQFADHFDPVELAELHETYSEEAWAANLADEAGEGASAALQIRRQLGDAEGLGRTLRLAARATWYRGDSGRALVLLDEAIAALEATSAMGEHARCLAYRALIGAIAGTPDDIEPYASLALEMADELGDGPTSAMVLDDVGTARARHGIDPGDLLEQALEHAKAAGLTTELVRVMANRAMVEVNQHHYSIAGEAIEEAFAMAGQLQVLAFHGLMSVIRARVALETGAWDAAERDARWVLSAPLDSGFARIPALTLLARLHTRRGEKQASSTLEEMWTLASASGEFQWIGPAAVAVAEHSILANRAGEAHDALAEAIARGGTHSMPWILGELHLWARRAGVPMQKADAADGYHRELDGDWVGALEVWIALGNPFNAAMTRAWSGDEDAMREALADLDALGAVAWASWLRARMRAAGIKKVPKGPSTATRDNPAGLTKRQVDVLRLLAEGLTNGEIASELFVSTRTVDHHVSAVLMKLGVGSRREAGAKLEELGLP